MITLNGLPAHIVLVHAIVVLLPLSALLLVATAVWPAARRKLAGINAVLATLTLLLVPVTTNAGEWLQARVDETSLVGNHADLGATALYVALPVAALAVLVWWRAKEQAAHQALSATAPARTEPHVLPSGGTTTLVAAPAPAPTVPIRRMHLAPASSAVTALVAVAAVLASGAAVYDVYLIGESGARAAWQDSFTQTPHDPEPGVAATDTGG